MVCSGCTSKWINRNISLVCSGCTSSWINRNCFWLCDPSFNCKWGYDSIISTYYLLYIDMHYQHQILMIVHLNDWANTFIENYCVYNRSSCIILIPSNRSLIIIIICSNQTLNAVIKRFEVNELVFNKLSNNHQLCNYREFIWILL